MIKTAKQQTKTESVATRMYKVPVVSVRMVREKIIKLPKDVCGDAEDSAIVVKSMIGDFDREALVAIFVNARNHILAVHVASIGGSSQCLVETAPIMRAALLACATGIVIGHNHPSGDPTPSHQDVRATQSIAAAAALLGIRFLDHVIVTSGDAYRQINWID